MSALNEPQSVSRMSTTSSPTIPAALAGTLGFERDMTHIPFRPDELFLMDRLLKKFGLENKLTIQIFRLLDAMTVPIFQMKKDQSLTQSHFLMLWRSQRVQDLGSSTKEDCNY